MHTHTILDLITYTCNSYLKKAQDLGISAPQILGFDVAWPKLWHKNCVFDQTLGCPGHFDGALEKGSRVRRPKTFYRYGAATRFLKAVTNADHLSKEYMTTVPPATGFITNDLL